MRHAVDRANATYNRRLTMALGAAELVWLAALLAVALRACV